MALIKVKKDNVAGLLAVLAGMILFKASTSIGWLETFLTKYAWIAIILAVVLFFNRDKIANKVGNGR